MHYSVDDDDIDDDNDAYDDDVYGDEVCGVCICVCVCAFALFTRWLTHFWTAMLSYLSSNITNIFPIFSAAIFMASVSSCVKYSSCSRWLIVSLVVLHSHVMCFCVSFSSWYKWHILFSHLSPKFDFTGIVLVLTFIMLLQCFLVILFRYRARHWDISFVISPMQLPIGHLPVL